MLGHVERAFKFYLAKGKKKERFGHTLDRIGLDKAFSEIFAEETVGEGKEVVEQASAVKNGNVLDLLGVCCPMNFVRTKLAIDKIKPGERIEILLDDGEPIINVTRSVKDEGHRVLAVAAENGHFRLTVEKRKNG